MISIWYMYSIEYYFKKICHPRRVKVYLEMTVPELKLAYQEPARTTQEYEEPQETQDTSRWWFIFFAIGKWKKRLSKTSTGEHKYTHSTSDYLSININININTKCVRLCASMNYDLPHYVVPFFSICFMNSVFTSDVG